MTLRVFSAVDGSNPRTLVGHTKTVTGLEIIGRGKTVLSGSMDGTVRLWNVASGECVKKWMLDQPVTAMVLVQPPEREDDLDGAQLLIAHSNGTASILDLSSSATTATLSTGSSSALDALAFHPATRTVALGSRVGVIHIFDLPVSSSSDKLEPQTSFTRSGAAIKSLAFNGSSTGLELIVATADGLPYRAQVSLNAPRVIEEYAGFDCESANALAVLGDGTPVLIASAEGEVRRYALGEVA